MSRTLTKTEQRWIELRQAGEILNPSPGHPVTFPFGVPGDWQAGFHPGEDHACPVGTILRAVTRGRVIGHNIWGADYGTHIVIESDRLRDGTIYRYAYCHMDRLGLPDGAEVFPGTFVGRSGNTGRTTGPHLHFEVRSSPFRYADRAENPLRVKKRPE